MMSVSRAEVCAVACAELFRDAGEIMVSPMTTIVSIGARLARLDLLPRHRADRRRGPPDRRHPGHRRDRGHRGLDAVRPGVRDAVLGTSPCGDGRQPDRPLRQSEPVRVRPGAAPDPADVRRARRARQHDQPRHQLLGRQPLHAGVLRDRRHRLRNRLGQGRSRQPGVPVRQHLSGWCPTSACSTSTARTTPCGRCRCIPGCEPEQVAENTSFEIHGLAEAAKTRLPSRATSSD